MLGLGIESTAHTFSCAVVERKGKRGEILSDVRKIYGPPDGQGIHPREASRHHVENSSAALVEALKEANVSVTDLDIISYAGGPGLGPCLPFLSTTAQENVCAVLSIPNPSILSPT